MVKVLIVYYSRTGNTRKMASYVENGVKEIPGAEVTTRSVDQVGVDDLLEYHAIIMGSPVYYGTMAAELKKLLDDSVEYHGQLSSKVGGAFASSGNIGGGNETTVMDIVKALLIHGMIVPGSAQGDHYGPVAVGAPDDRAAEECRKLGRLVTSLAVKLSNS